jgi:hypothetical protein
MLNSHKSHESVSDRVLIILLEKFKQENLSKKHTVARSVALTCNTWQSASVLLSLLSWHLSLLSAAVRINLRPYCSAEENKKHISFKIVKVD